MTDDNKARDPASEAVLIVHALDQLYAQIEGRSFVEDYFVPMQADPSTSGDAAANLIGNETSIRDAIVAACAYSIQGVRAAKAGQTNAAWAFVVDAQFWRASAQVFAWVKQHPNAMRSELGKLARRPSAAISEDAKALVKRWCECEGRLELFRGTAKGKGLNALARAADEANLVSDKYATIRRWLTTWAVEWRADGRWHD
jgi:hypothetical protein